METRAPTPAKVLTMALFALSCVGLLLFLWLSFGGTIPFQPSGYQIRVSFPYADQLATQADVRISGVSVGTVVAKTLDPDGNRTIATLQIENPYAPIHTDATAILRTKTILGETYVELTPGTPGSPYLKDGQLLARSNVLPSVQLDQIFSTFDPKTRRAFQVWQQSLAKAINGDGQALNDVLGNLPTFAANANDILTVLDVQQNAVKRLIGNGGIVFAAISKDQSALRNLITSSETTFATTAANQASLAATFHVFPTFLNQTKTTLARLQTFAEDTDPLIKELEPVAQNLGPTLHDVRNLAPYLRRFFVKLGPLVTVSKTGLPAVRDILRGATPLLGALGPFLEQVNPIFNWFSLHQQLISDFISQGGSALNAKTEVFGGGGSGHYLRQFSPEGPDTLSIDTNRDSNNRGDTYPNPLWLDNSLNFTKGDFPAWDCANAGGEVSTDTTPGAGHQSCWVAPTLPGAQPGQIPHILAAKYPSN
jgi:phospholipid/cholesterol/gamma-HCH transport system substrate-binding protein